MISFVLQVLLALAVAVGGGAASVWYALENDVGRGTMQLDGWTADPQAGIPGANPYSRARAARDAALPLGAAEGLTFRAGRDAEGRRLLRSCTYRIEGPLPVGRFWTIHVPTGSTADEVTQRHAALHSYELLRESDNTFVITVSPHPAPGNWLAVGGDGPMQIVLTLYDTPVATSTAVGEIELPRISLASCDG